MDKEKLDYSKYSRKELILHATLLGRSVNKCMSKEEMLQLYCKVSEEELIYYIEHFHDPEPDEDLSYADEQSDTFNECFKERHTCCSARDYGPSNPWDAPGMSVRDFI